MSEEPNGSEDGGGQPPGYRFFPTEEELLGFYLQNKLCNRREDMKRVIPLAHVYHFDPWQLPGISGERSVGDTEQWFFFCARQEREAHGGRPTRTTPSGYWKATGSPGPVYSSSGRLMGVKKTMVFYQGRAPTGAKTKWKMNEYRALDEGGATSSSNPTPKLRSEFSLCRVYVKSGCLRSFDRRPSDGAAAAPASAGGRMIDAAAASDDENPPAAQRRRTHDCSSSDGRGDHRSPPTGGQTDLKMLEGIEWDTLDWD